VSALTAPVLVREDEALDESYYQTAVGAEIRDWKNYIELEGKSPATVYQYTRDLAGLVLMFPDVPIRKFTDSHILAWLKTVPAPSRPSRLDGGVSSFFRWARMRRRIRENPLDFVPRAKQKRGRHIPVFSQAEVDDFLSLPARDAVLMAIMFGAGLRKGECQALQVRRLKVAEEPAHVVVLEGKGDKDRYADFLPDMAEIVREFLLLNDLAPTDYLWYSKPGGSERAIRRDTKISGAAFSDWWDRCRFKARVRDDAGNREANPHLTRHTYATEYLRRGGRLETLSLSMGHASIKTTFDLYAHMDVRDRLIDLAAIAENSPVRNG
jgi:integrase